MVVQLTTEDDRAKLAMAYAARWLGDPSLNMHQKLFVPPSMGQMCLLVCPLDRKVAVLPKSTVRV